MTGGSSLPLWLSPGSLLVLRALTGQERARRVPFSKPCCSLGQEISPWPSLSPAPHSPPSFLTSLQFFLKLLFSDVVLGYLVENFSPLPVWSFSAWHLASINTLYPLVVSLPLSINPMRAAVFPACFPVMLPMPVAVRDSVFTEWRMQKRMKCISRTH